MNTSQEVKQADTGEVQQDARRNTFLRPPVDIYEDEKELILKADLPGVSKDQLNISVDGQTLNMEADMSFALSEDMTALYADLQSNRFQRSFTLSNELEDEKINAQMEDGVLTLRIPKREELQPRKIEVQSG